MASHKKINIQTTIFYLLLPVLLIFHFSLFAQPVKVLSPLKSNKDFSDINSSDKIYFKAEFDQETNWKLILNGKTSGKSDTLNGHDSVVDISWNSQKWNINETVIANLNIHNLDKSVPDSSLSLSFNLFRSQSIGVIEPGGIIRFQNFENGSVFNNFGGTWSCFTDINTGGKSNISPLNAHEFIVAGAGNSGHAIQINLNVDQVAGIETTLRKSSTVNLSNFESIIFDYKTSGTIDSLNFVLSTTNITDLAYRYISIQASSTWKTVKVNFKDLHPPNWSSSDNFLDLNLCSKFRWEVLGPDKGGTFLLDNIQLKLKDGLLPDEDIMSLITSSVRKKLKHKNNHIFEIFQSNKGLLIKSPNRLPSRLEIFNLNGNRVFQDEIYSTNSFFIPIYNLDYTPGQYIILLCDKPGSPFMMARKFILQ